MADWDFDCNGQIHGDMLYLNDRVSEITNSLTGKESNAILDSLAENLTRELLEDTNLISMMTREEIKYTVLDRIYYRLGEKEHD